MRSSLVALLMVLVAPLSGCNCGEAFLVDDDGGSLLSGVDGGGGTESGTDGGAGGQPVPEVDAGFTPDAACAVADSQATLARRPVDIIFVIDNSGSMTAEIIGVEQNINSNFASIIGASGLDYRVILLARHGSASGEQSVCITQPLSANATCSPPPAQPTNTSRFFHYSVEIGSRNSFDKILGSYAAPDPSGAAPGGWSQWLRPDSLKAFVEITDDNESSTPASFETALFALTPKLFGDATDRNYVFHSVVGVKIRPNPTDGYTSTEPVVVDKCASAVNTGEAYQELSRITGGLRFPVCDPSKYDTVFQAVAQGVVDSAQVACEFDVPTPPDGSSFSSKIITQYTPGAGGAVQTFAQVADVAACAGASFYLEGTRIFLCAEACSAVKSDTAAKVSVYFTCETELQ